MSNDQVVVQNEVDCQIWLKLCNCWAECLFAMVEISDGVSRLGLGLETRLKTLHRLVFMKFCKKEFL